MKKITLLLVIIFTFLFSTPSYGQHNWGKWTFVSMSVDFDKYYYDKDRVRKSGKYIYFWELTDYIKPDDLWGYLSTTKYIQLDCNIIRFKVLKIQTYNKPMGEGKQEFDFTVKEEFTNPKPNSVREVIYNKICEEYQ